NSRPGHCCGSSDLKKADSSPSRSPGCPRQGEVSEGGSTKRIFSRPTYSRVRFSDTVFTAHERSGQLYHSLSLETFRQPLARPAETHVDCRRVDGQQPGDLLRVVVQGVAKGEDLPIPLGHLFEHVT